MFEKMMNVEVGFKTTEVGVLEFHISGFKPVVNAGMYEMIKCVSTNNKMTVEQYCHQLLEQDKAIKLASINDDEFDAFNYIIDAEMSKKEDGFFGFLKNLLGEEEDCDTCAKYDECTSPNKTEKTDKSEA